MKKAIFLDFDGVLFNTVKEAYIVSVMTYKQIIDIEKITFKTQEYTLFFKYRYLIGPAWNYKYLLNQIYENKFVCPHKYKEDIENAEISDYQLFEIEYFKNRKFLIDNYYSFWLSLNETYPFLKKIVEMFSLKFFIIISTKDKYTILKLLEEHQIDFPCEYIYDKNDYKKTGSKAKIILDIMSKYDITKSLFIEDSDVHIEKCKCIKNLKILKPEWGYVNKKSSISSEIEILEEISFF
jgi:hypothetical protein